MDNKNQQPGNRITATVSPPALSLTPEETAIVTLIRSNSYQEISVQIQEAVITSVDQTIKYRRKKGGGLMFGAKKIDRSGLTPHEIELIMLLREKPYQQVIIKVMDSEIKGFDQTVKFKKKG